MSVLVVHTYGLQERIGENIMMKEEFEKLIGKEVSNADYKVINHVYTFHTAISETEGKQQMAGLYNLGGMPLIRSMVECADIMQDLEAELLKAQARLKSIETRIENARENGIKEELRRRELLDAFDRTDTITAWDFMRSFIASQYSEEMVDKLVYELNLSFD